MKIVLTIIGLTFLAVFNKVNAQLDAYDKVELIYVSQPHGQKLLYTVRHDIIIVAVVRDSTSIDSIIYKGSLDKQKGFDYFNMLQSFHIDTLDNYYDGGGYDGFDLLLRLFPNKQDSRNFGFHNYRHPIIVSLIEATNKFIPDKKLKLEY